MMLAFAGRAEVIVASPPVASRSGSVIGPAAAVPLPFALAEE
jgi:hypothetical protein